MMRFKGYYDQNPQKEKFRLHRKHIADIAFRATAWPTVDELEDVIAPMTADTVLQILRGQGIYRGWDCIEHDGLDYDATERRAVQYKRDIARQERKAKLVVKPTPRDNYRKAYRALDKQFKKAIQVIAEYRMITIEQATKLWLELTTTGTINGE